MWSKRTIASVLTALIGLAAMVHSLRAESVQRLQLSGLVRPIHELDVEPTAQAASLDLDSSSNEQTVTVGLIREISNSIEGYRVTLYSENARVTGENQPYLKHQDSPDRINYNLTYGEQAVDLDGDGQAVVSDSTEKTAADGVSRSLKITYRGRSDSGTGQILTPGLYSDSLVLEIASR